MARHILLFNGYDTNVDQALWVTNGAAGGTTEIGGIGNSGISGAYTMGLNPTNLSVFNGEVLFAGEDAAVDNGLWVSNGTAAGTTEIGGIGNSGISGVFLSGNGALGLSPNDFTIFNGVVLFAGKNTGGAPALWVTNGTASGTTEIGGLYNSGVSGADTGGLVPSALTVYGSEVLFSGADSTGGVGLWVTNGTAGGTTEIGGSHNSGVSGVAPTLQGLDPASLTVLGSEVLFTGEDKTGDRGLWVTNGTANGTSEVGGVGNSGISGVNTAGLSASDLTVLGSEVLFYGVNTAGHHGLWVTNGTATGTSELTGITGANIDGVQPTDLTVFGNEVLFNGVDTAGNNDLWVTNGTAAGTSEVPVSGAWTGNSGGLNPGGLTIFNGEVLFDGKDTTGKFDLWVTNGTTAGTSEVTGVSGANTNETGLDPTFLTSLTVPSAPDDFYASGTSDVLFRNDAVGDTGFYVISNGVNTGWRDIGASSTAYSIVGTGDFYNNGTEDILFRSASTGDTGFYQIVNGAVTNWRDVGVSSTAYSVVGVGDFTGSGTDDILYRDNTTTGDTGFYKIVNGVNTGWVDVGASSTAYSVVGVGDFTGSGTDDILYRSSSTGDTGFYTMVNGIKTGWFDIGATSTAYSVVGTGDFLGNGTDDILFRDNSTGDTGFYAVNNGIVSWHDIGPSSTAYSVVATGDYLGPGTSDILFRNNTSGDTGFYAISNGVNTGWHEIAVTSTAYHVVS